MKGNPVVPGLTGVPPGHWGDPAWAGLPPTWLPYNWKDLGIPGPLDVVWNPDIADWGVWWADQFIPFVAQTTGRPPCLSAGRPLSSHGPESVAAH